LLNVDSAEKPSMVKKKHLKTPPKHSHHSEKAAHNRSWQFLYLTLFPGFGEFSKQGVFSAESNV
jgi:hypothetical protein